MPSNGSTSNFRLLWLEIGSRNILRHSFHFAGAAGNTKSMSLRGTVDGINAFILTVHLFCRSSTVTLEGTTQQDIFPKYDALYFYNLTMNNPAESTLSTPIYIYNYLNMTVGIITSSYTNLWTSDHPANANGEIQAPYHRTTKIYRRPVQLPDISSWERQQLASNGASTITFYKTTELHWWKWLKQQEVR